MESRRWWAWASRAWLFAFAIVLAYANLLYTGTRLVGDLPGYAVVVPFVIACGLTWRACSLADTEGSPSSGEDPLQLTCGALTAFAGAGGCLMLGAHLLDRSWIQLAAIPLILVGGCGLLLFGLAVATLPIVTAIVLLVGKRRGRAVAALAIQAAAAALVLFGPRAFVAESRDRDAALDCTLERRAVALALEKRGRPLPAIVDEDLLKELVGGKWLKRLPRHRVGSQTQTPRYYVVRGHLVCMTHMRGMF